MFEKYRETHDLLVDYAEALREGSLPTFLKSLSRFEGQHVLPIPNFWYAAEMVRILNNNGFADEMSIPSMDLFLARVNARIASRRKQAKGWRPKGGKRKPSQRPRRL